jgi:transaldolase
MKAIVEKMNEIGQSIWYDNIERRLLVDGTLAGMVKRGEIRGITSNPSIFNNAISQSSDYDLEIQSLAEEGLEKEGIYERLAVKDIQDAADLFRDLYDQTKGADGYVSLEVSPYLAHDTEKTIQEAERIWGLVDRPNLMVKIPATLEGLLAITEAISKGININVTLIFSLERYNRVREAYLAGLEKRFAAGEDISRVASVASFFISRIDTKVDKKLTTLKEKAESSSQEKIDSLFGKTAIASGKLAFLDYEKTFTGDERYLELAENGAQRQRALWASTSTKNPAYPDTMYVDELIGPNTINTIPPKTLQAFLEHGTVKRTIDQDLDGSRKTFADLTELGIDLIEVTQELEDEGVKAFADAFTSLLDSLDAKIQKLKK